MSLQPDRSAEMRAVPSPLTRAILVGLLLGAAPLHAQQPAPGPITIREAVSRALEQGLELRDARLALQVADEQAQEAWSQVYPSIDFTASYARNLSPAVNFLPANIFDPTAPEGEFISVQFGADNAWNTAITVEQPLFEAGAFLGVGAAGRFRILQEEVVRGRTQDAVTSVRLGYYDLLLAQEELRLTTNSVRRLEESLAENRALLEAGIVPEYDVLRLEVELANVRPNLRRAEDAIDAARRTLAIRLGFGAAVPLEVAGSLAQLDLEDPDANSPENRELLDFGSAVASTPESEADAVARAREARSELRQLDLTEDLRRTELRLEQVEYLPKVNLFGSYSITAQENGNPNFFGASSSQRGYARQIGLSVTLPLFTGLSRDSRIDQKRLVVEQVETQRELATRTSDNEVRTLLARVEESLERAAAQRFAVEQAERGFEIASAQYREGIGSQLERTDAEVALRQSEFNYAAAVYDYLVARAQLDRVTGQVPMVDATGVSTNGGGEG